MSVVLYILPERLSIYELSHGNVRKCLDYFLEGQDLENLREYLRSHSEDTRYQVIVDMPGDVVVRRTLPRVGRTQRSRLIDGLLAKNLGHLSHRTALLSASSNTRVTNSEVRLFALGDTFARSTWYSLLEEAEIWIAGLYSASLLTEVALIATVNAETKLLLCTRSGAESLRFLYFESGELLFTRVTDSDVHDRAVTLQQIESTRQYIVSEFSQLDEFSMAVAITPDVPLAVAECAELDGSEDRQSALHVTVLNKDILGQRPRDQSALHQQDVSYFEYVLVHCLRDVRALKPNDLYRRVLLRNRISLRNCNSVSMRYLSRQYRSRHACKMVALYLAGFSAVLCIVFSASGVYLSTQSRLITQVETDRRQDLEVINSKLAAFDHDAFMMRDSVVVRESLQQRFNSSVDLLTGLAEIFNQVEGIAPATLSWSAATTEATHRKLLPDAVEVDGSPDALQVQLIGFLAPTYQTVIEGYGRYEKLLEQISLHNQFTLLVQERKPFGSARRNDIGLTAVDNNRSEFTLMLEFAGS